jgi:hypothetical protein
MLSAESNTTHKVYTYPRVNVARPREDRGGYRARIAIIAKGYLAKKRPGSFDEFNDTRIHKASLRLNVFERG